MKPSKKARRTAQQIELMRFTEGYSTNKAARAIQNLIGSKRK